MNVIFIFALLVFFLLVTKFHYSEAKSFIIGVIESAIDCILVSMKKFMVLMALMPKKGKNSKNYSQISACEKKLRARKRIIVQIVSTHSILESDSKHFAPQDHLHYCSCSGITSIFFKSLENDRTDLKKEYSAQYKSKSSLCVRKWKKNNLEILCCLIVDSAHLLVLLTSLSLRCLLLSSTGVLGAM